MHRKFLILVAVLVFVGLAYFLLRHELTPSPDESTAKSTARIEAEAVRTRPAVTTPEPLELPVGDAAVSTSESDTPRESIDLPSLSDSDGFIRERLEAFGLPLAWTNQVGLVRRLAVLVDAATRDEWPRQPLRFLKPAGRFNVIERDGHLYADPRNASRFDADLDLLESIDPSAAAKFLELIDPLLDAALGDLGRPVDGRETVLEAIDAVLDSRVAIGEVELVRPKVLYQYADPELEALPRLEKQLLRLGPKNASRLKAYLSQLRDALARTDR